ncbi:restriction endonuclease, partial [Escherichia coli]|nr:restriction endonuclease [Escherichia coli]
CSRTTFEVNCPWCSGVSPVKTSAWGSASSTAQAIGIQRMTPLNPSFYPEFQYRSKGVLKDLFGKKKEQTQLNQLLENVLKKYSSLKDPYFTNFIYTSRFSHNNKSEADYSTDNGTYSELQL